MGTSRLDALSSLRETLLPRMSPRRGGLLVDGWTTVLTPRGLHRAAPGVSRQAQRADVDVVLLTLDVVDVTDAADPG